MADDLHAEGGGQMRLADAGASDEGPVLALIREGWHPRNLQQSREVGPMPTARPMDSTLAGVPGRLKSSQA